MSTPLTHADNCPTRGHDSLATERFRQQLADDDLVRRAEGWGA